MSTTRIALSEADTRVCRDAFPFNHLTLAEVSEYERLAGCLNLKGRTAVRYVYLFGRKYFPPGAPPPEAA